ncbi:MAG: UbiA family prenyltransferase [Euryarchaeota archaeon]|nr:UbiA family prenyltransferase [Euryarchaeota archaeon]
MHPFIRITRPSNSIMSGFAVLIAGIIAGGFPITYKVVLASFVSILACAGGMVINDYFDYEIDKINREERVLPKKEMSLQTALIYAIFLFLLACFMAYFVNLKAFLICLIAVVSMILYAYKLKRTCFVGNITVSFLTSLTFLYGGAAVNKMEAVGLLFLCSFLASVSREIMKDIEDIKGDKTMGSVTVPIVYGEKKSILISQIFLFLAILATYLPYLYNIFGIEYLLMISILDLFVLRTAYISKKNILRAEKTLKLEMYGVLAIFFLSKIIETILA